MARVQPDIIFADVSGRVGSIVTDRIAGEGIPQEEGDNRPPHQEDLGNHRVHLPHQKRSAMPADGKVHKRVYTATTLVVMRSITMLILSFVEGATLHINTGRR